MARRNRVRLPRDLASREPYVPPDETEDLVNKFDSALSAAAASSDGWHVITRKGSSGHSTKPRQASARTLSLAEASAALDAVVKTSPSEERGAGSANGGLNGRGPLEVAKKSAENAVGQSLPQSPSVVPDVAAGDIEVVKKEGDDLAKRAGVEEVEDVDVEEAEDLLADDADFESGELDGEDHDLASEEEDAAAAKRRRQEERHRRSSKTTTRSPSARSVSDKKGSGKTEKAPDKTTTKTGRPPAVKSAKKTKPGRGLGRRIQEKKPVEVVSSVNPMVEEAISTAAAELAPHPGQDGGAERLDDEDRQAIEDFTAVARSPSTLATYRSDLRQFSDWCAQKGIRSFPAEPSVVAAWASFLAKKKKLKFDQIERKVAAISAAHVALKHQSPCQDSTVKNVMVGIKSALESDQSSVASISPSDLTAIMTDAPKTSRWRRNKAMLLLGFSAALRRSELVEIRMEGLRFTDEGLILAIPGRMSRGVETVMIPKVKGKLCAVGALAKWIALSRITKGYVFRPMKDGVVDPDPDDHLPAIFVTKIIKEAVKLIGLDPRRYTGRSLRIGYAEAVQEAARKTIRDIDYVRQTLKPQVL